MPDNKSFTIRADIDDTGLNRKLSEIQRKIKDMQNQTKMAEQTMGTLRGDPQLGRYASELFGGVSQQGLNELRQQEQQLRRKAENERIALMNKKRNLEDMLRSEQAITEEGRKQIEQQKESIRLLEQKSKGTLGDISSTVQQRGRMGDQAQVSATGVNLPGAQPQGMGAFRQMLGGLATGAVVSAIANAVGTAMQDVINRERIVTQAQGTAARGIGQDIQRQFQGRGSEAMFFANERAEAMRMAAEEAANQDLLTGGGTLGSIASGAAGGFMIGGPKGALIGGLGGLGARMFSSERARSQVFDRERFKSLVSAEGIQNYQANLEALKAQDPSRTLAQQYFAENAGSLANFQLQMGFGSSREMIGEETVNPNFLDMPTRRGVSGSRLQGTYKAGETDAQFQARVDQVNQENMRRRQRAAMANVGRDEGYLINQMNMGEALGGVGFTQAQIMQSAGGIAQAGGQTAAGRDLAGFGAALNRQFRMRQGAQLLGGLSGAGLDSGQTEDATKRLLAEGMKMGIDASTMPREMERMVQVTAQLATAGGGFARGAVDAFTSGLTGLDQTSITAARDAAEMFKQTGKAAGGFEGQMGYGFLQSRQASKILGGKRLGSTEMNYLNQISSSEVTEEDLQGIAGALGVEPEQVRELLKEKDIYKQTRTTAEAGAMRDLGAKLEGMDATQIGEYLKTEEGSTLLAKAEMQTTASRGTEFSGMTRAQRRARMVQLATGGDAARDQMVGPGQEAGAVEGQFQTRIPGAFIDEQGSQATGDRARIRSLQQNLDDLGKAARKHTENAELYNTQFDLFITALKNNKDALDTVKTQFIQISEDLSINFPGSGINSSKVPGSN